VITKLGTRTAAVALLAGTVLGGSAFATRSFAAARPAKPTKVVTDLREFDITTAKGSAKPGPVAFAMKNRGGVDHELIVVRLPRVGAALPMKADGSVDEAAIAPADKVAEVDSVAPGKSKTLSIPDLPAGSYQLFCNLVNVQPDGRVVSHYQLGMHSAFAVRR
jgi:uncharacterized cupredoxin-like copper-binding protein